MGRPSLKQQRTEEILSAFMHCVGRFGLEGATLERIAEQADMARPMLRHYMGNRDDMITALTNYLVTRFDQQTDAMEKSMPKTGRVGYLISLLFSPPQPESSIEVSAFQAMVVASREHPEVRESLLRSLQRFNTFVENELTTAYPERKRRTVEAVAQGIIGIYFNIYSMAALDPPDKWLQDSRLAAGRLLSTLS